MTTIMNDSDQDVSIRKQNELLKLENAQLKSCLERCLGDQERVNWLEKEKFNAVRLDEKLTELCRARAIGFTVREAIDKARGIAHPTTGSVDSRVADNTPTGGDLATATDLVICAKQLGFEEITVQPWSPHSYSTGVSFTKSQTSVHFDVYSSDCINCRVNLPRARKILELFATEIDLSSTRIDS